MSSPGKLLKCLLLHESRRFVSTVCFSRLTFSNQEHLQSSWFQRVLSQFWDWSCICSIRPSTPFSGYFIPLTLLEMKSCNALLRVYGTCVWTNRSSSEGPDGFSSVPSFYEIIAHFLKPGFCVILSQTIYRQLCGKPYYFISVPQRGQLWMSSVCACQFE